MAARGVASRRASEELIAAGRVSVDGRIVTQLGAAVEPDADIRVDGRAIKEPHKLYYMLNKPKGYITTLADEHARKSVGNLVSKLRNRVYPVGRLDAETEGLLLLTNDGLLTNVLTHPRFKVEKTYLVSVKGRMSDEAVGKLREGIYLREGKAAAHVRVLRATRDTTSLEMVISQGYNRQIRRMCAAVGHEVRRLERVRFGPLRLKGLPRGGFRVLTPEEVSVLKSLEAAAAGHKPVDSQTTGRGEPSVGRKRAARRRR
jgi:pseudouridine synthase